jgi:uncharacterized protein involved in tolerance to divalent cations
MGRVVIENTASEQFGYSILDIYFSDITKRIKETYEKQRDDIIEKDEIQRIFKTAKNKLEKVFKEEGLDIHRYRFFDPDLMTERTKELLKQLRDEYDAEIKQQNSILREVDGMLELADTYEQKLEILQKYDIVDEEGNYVF